MGCKNYSFIYDIDPCDFYHILYFEKKNLLVQLMTPICDQSFKINRTEVNKLLKGSMNQWVYLQYRTPIHKPFFLRFSVNWPQLLGIFVCTGVNLVLVFWYSWINRRSTCYIRCQTSAHNGTHTDWILFEGKSNASYCD